jgi:GH15 family glucan-1,4-alpha-glucosidase
VCYTGSRRQQIVRSVQLVHLLSYAPHGSLIAAPTTSLPEGTWTADYRFAWVRDASLSLAILAMLGLSGEAQRYMDWLVTLRSSNDSPLQVLYGIRGELDLTPRERTDVHGYRGAQPIHAGNQAWRHFQLDSLGYLVDCALMYLEDGGAWRPEYWNLVRRCVAFTAASCASRILESGNCPRGSTT